MYFKNAGANEFQRNLALISKIFIVKTKYIVIRTNCENVNIKANPINPYGLKIANNIKRIIKLI